MFKRRTATSAANALATLILGLLLSAGAAVAQPQSGLRYAHTAFHAALRDADASALGRLLDEHFMWTHTIERVHVSVGVSAACGDFEDAVEECK